MPCSASGEEKMRNLLLASGETCDWAGKLVGSWLSWSELARRGREVGSWRREQMMRGRTSG